MTQAFESFDAVRDFLARTPFPPTTEQIGEIRWALRDISDRLARVRMVAPKTDLTDRMWKLMEIAGLPVKPIKKPNLVPK